MNRHPGDIDEGPTGVLAGEPHALPPLPQRTPGATLGADDVAEAIVTRADRHIEVNGSDR
jgi:hypothetical protein